MRVSRFLIVGLLSLVAEVPDAGAAPDATSATLSAAVTQRRLCEAVRLFGALPTPSGDDEYLAGHALMDLHRTEDAAPHLDAAKTRGWSKWPGWPSADALLERVRTVREATPPRWTAPAADSSIDVYAGPATKWSAPVLQALPEFADVGRRIFGKDVPTVRLHLFADRPTYDRFYGALFGGVIPDPWQDGTGTTNVVTFCETDRTGKTTRVAGAPESVSCVLHEFSHAWCGTYLMDRYDKEWIGPALRRAWLDEGLADFVASLREPAFLTRRAAWLKAKAAKGAPAPTFDDIATFDAFYKRGDVGIHYWVSALFVAELLGPVDKAPETIRKILDAVGTSGDVERSVETVTGKDLRKEFERVVKRFW